MKVKVVGLGQCGSIIVYDVLAHLFDGRPSIELRSASNRSEYIRDVEGLVSRFTKPVLNIRNQIGRYFLGSKTADLPRFYVVDGNKNNAMIAGLQDEKGDSDELILSVSSFNLADINTGCSYGQVGEYYFRREKSIGKDNAINRIDLDDTSITDVDFIVFAGGGGSGSGGAIVLNEEVRKKQPLLFNMIVLPPQTTDDFRLRFNTGRCITRLSKSDSQTSMMLFSNLSDDAKDQFAVNEYIREAIIRFANMSFPGNIPKWGTDVDPADIQSFFSGRPSFMGLSSSDRPERFDEDQLFEELADRALRSRIRGSAEGLSIEVSDGEDTDAFKGVAKVLVVLGAPPHLDASKIDAPHIIRQAIKKRLGRSNVNIAVYSYGSTSRVEIAVFFRYNYYSNCHLMSSYFDEGFFRWYKGETTEMSYLQQDEENDGSNIDLKDIYKFTLNQMGVKDPKMDPYADNTLNQPLERPK